MTKARRIALLAILSWLIIGAIAWMIIYAAAAAPFFTP